MKNKIKKTYETAVEIDHSDDPIYRRAVDDTRHKLKESLKDMVGIQCSHGNWNYDPYMMGLANGLILAQSLVTGEEPKFLDAPKKWLKDYPSLWTKIKWFLKGGPPVASESTNELLKQP